MSDNEEQDEQDEPQFAQPEQGEPEPEQDPAPVNLVEDTGRATHVAGTGRNWKEKLKYTTIYVLGDEHRLKYLIMFIAFLVVFATTFTLKIQERLVLAFVAALVVYILWRRTLPSDEKPMIKEGFVVTWADKSGLFPYLKREQNLKLVWCQFALYPDGVVETVPETEYLGAYLPEAINHIKWNPLIDMDVKKHFERAYQQEIPYADGTGSHNSPLEVKYRRISKAIQSGTPMAVKKTTTWLHGG